MQQAIPTALAMLQNGSLRVQWGSGFSDAPEAASTVLAYEKRVADQGGDVLMQDGSIKSMTAAEFKSAPQAKSN